MKRLLLSLTLLAALLVACNTPQQTTTYNTLYSLEQATTAAYNGYFALVAKGSLPTNTVPKVSQTFNQVQAGLILALDAAQNNTNALAPANLAAESADFLTLVTTIEGGK